MVIFPSKQNTMWIAFLQHPSHQPRWGFKQRISDNRLMLKTSKSTVNFLADGIFSTSQRFAKGYPQTWKPDASLCWSDLLLWSNHSFWTRRCLSVTEINLTWKSHNLPIDDELFIIVLSRRAHQADAWALSPYTWMHLSYSVRIKTIAEIAVWAQRSGSRTGLKFRLVSP